MSWTVFLSLLGAILGIAGGLGGASAFFLRDRAKGLIELQNGEIKTLRDSNDERLKKLEDCQGTMTEMQKQVEFLKGVVTQAPQIAELLTMVKLSAESTNNLTNMIQAYMAVTEKTNANTK